jgi:putative peptidoglycan lipid II flippase
MRETVETVEIQPPPKEHSVGRAVVRSAGMIGMLTLVSRVMGLARDVGGAGIFGAGPVWDAFAFAWMMPNLFRELFGEGALNAAFVPVFSDYLVNKSKAEAVRLFNVVATALTIVLAAIAVVCILGSYPVQWILSAHRGVDLSLQFSLIRILFPYLLLICLVALAMGLLNSFRHFAAPAFAPIVLNVFWIAGIFVVAPGLSKTAHGQIMILAVLILLSGFAQLFVQIPPILRNGVTLRPVLDFRHPGLKKIVTLLVPRFIGLAPVKINVFVDGLIAMTLARPGANSVLYYGNRMMQFPLAIIGIAMATAIFPILARYGARNEIGNIKRAASQTLRLTLIISVPASLGLVFLAKPIIRLFFQLGEFTPEAVSRAAAVLVFYGAGVWIFCCLQIITRIFYSIGDTKTPTKVAVSTMVLNLILNLSLVGVLDAAGLALSTSICAVINMVVLVYALNVRGIQVWGERLPGFALKLVVAGAAMTAAGLAALNVLPESSHKMGQLISLFVPLAASAAVFLLAAWALRIRELTTLLQAVFTRKKSAAPQGN